MGRNVNILRLTEAKEFIAGRHRNANNLYNEILPYEFHLNIALQVAEEFVELLPDDTELVTDVFIGVYGHDLMEETNLSYNDVREKVGTIAADIIYALMNEKGKNRKERANDKYYLGIRNTPFAVFGKLCDRIANVRFGKFTRNYSMVEMYRKENEEFLRQLGFETLADVTHPYFPMVEHLNELLYS